MLFKLVMEEALEGDDHLSPFTFKSLGYTHFVLRPWYHTLLQFLVEDNE